MAWQDTEDPLNPFAAAHPEASGFGLAGETESAARWSSDGDSSPAEKCHRCRRADETLERPSDTELEQTLHTDTGEAYEAEQIHHVPQDPEFGVTSEEERPEYDVTVGNADSWAELELPVSVFTEEDEDEGPYAVYEDEARPPLEPGLSPLGIRGPLHPGNGSRPSPWLEQVYGLVVHTTGGCIPAYARAAGQRPDLYAAQFYLRTGGTHYVNGWDALEGQQLHQVMNERHVASGVGRAKGQPDQWKSIDAGRFEADLPKDVRRLWRARWPGVKDSFSLMPVRGKPNTTYVHVECVPCRYASKVIRDIKGNMVNCEGAYVTAPEAVPMRSGLHFTRAQHETVVRLAWDISQRHGWPRDSRWWRTPRLLGHEDLTPLSRCDEKGGYDPGALRDTPMFDWNFVYDGLERLRNGSAVSSFTPVTAVTALKSTVGGLLGSVAGRFRQLVRAGQEILAITEAIRSGQTDVNQLANLVFYARHPELKGRRLRPEERGLAQEWLDLRDSRVQPLLARLSPVRPSAAVVDRR